MTKTRNRKGAKQKPVTVEERERSRLRALELASEKANSAFFEYWEELTRRFASMDPESARLLAEMNRIEPGGDREPLRCRGEARETFCRLRDEWDAKFGAKWKAFERADAKSKRLYQEKEAARRAYVAALPHDDDEG